jgi:hypothetical protein
VSVERCYFRVFPNEKKLGKTVLLDVLIHCGFCVDCWLRSLSATPLRFEPYHDVCAS